jgi:hypothetical protein
MFFWLMIVTMKTRRNRSQAQPPMPPQPPLPTRTAPESNHGSREAPPEDHQQNELGEMGDDEFGDGEEAFLFVGAESQQEQPRPLGATIVHPRDVRLRDDPNPWLLRHGGDGDEEDAVSPEHEEDDGRGDQTLTSPSWILRIRDPNRMGSVVQLQVPHATTPQALSEGIKHALQLEGEETSSQTTIPGLFAEDDGVYYFLIDLLSSQSQRRPRSCRSSLPSRVFSLRASLFPPPSSSSSGRRSSYPAKVRRMWDWLQATLTVPGIAAAAVLVAGALFQTHLIAWAQDSVGWLGQGLLASFRLAHDRMVQSPIQDLYRNGPWIVGGWEGDRIERVCSRITYHGDEAFWSRNAGECERIYAAKEEAYLRLARPLAYLLLVACWSWVVSTILPLVRPAPRRMNPMERDAVETYRALQVLLRQAKKNS